MDTHNAESKLKDYILNGLVREIYFADEAKALVVAIGEYADRINAARFGRLFGSLQVTYSDRQTLCVTKIFEPKNRTYPTRTIPTIVDLIEECAECWSLPNKELIQTVLISSGYPAHLVNGWNNEKMSKELATYYRRTMPQKNRAADCSLSRSLIALRQARDKVIAHNEAIAESARSRVTWGETEALVSYAKDFAATIGYGFLNLTLGGTLEQYYLTNNAHETSFELRQFFERWRRSEVDDQDQ